MFSIISLLFPLPAKCSNKCKYSSINSVKKCIQWKLFSCDILNSHMRPILCISQQETQLPVNDDPLQWCCAMQWVCLVCHKKDWSRSKRLHCVGYFFFSFEKNPTAFQRIILSYWLWLLILLLSFHERLFRHHLQHNQANSEN